MVESTKEVLLKEINLNFFIQDVKVEVKEGLNSYHEYYKLYGKIRDGSQGEISLAQLSPENMTVGSILNNIKKLYNIYRYAENVKLREGSREEMLKLIALLIWRLG
jgi:hypothetical protein